MKSRLLLLMVVLGSLIADGKSYFNTVSNNFGGLFAHPGMRMQGRYKAIEGDWLIEENASMGTAVSLDTTIITSTAYRYQLRLANLNNKQGKSRSIKNPMTGSKTTLTSFDWGLIFNYDQDGNYCAVILSCDNSTPFDDITDQRVMQVKLIKREDSSTTELAQTTLSKGVSLEDGMNTLCVDVNERNVRISIGKEELEQILEADLSRPEGEVGVGYLVGPGSRVAIERAVLTI